MAAVQRPENNRKQSDRLFARL